MDKKYVFMITEFDRPFRGITRPFTSISLYFLMLCKTTNPHVAVTFCRVDHQLRGNKERYPVEKGKKQITLHF
jgi:hypothetical protein